jgi:hypothetical protein
MMFGFGDDQNPYTESVDLLEGETTNFKSKNPVKKFNLLFQIL